MDKHKPRIIYQHNFYKSPVSWLHPDNLTPFINTIILYMRLYYNLRLLNAPFCLFYISFKYKINSLNFF